MREVTYSSGKGSILKKGFFHHWGMGAQFDVNGNGWAVSVGIIEDDAGRIITVTPDYITFIKPYHEAIDETRSVIVYNPGGGIGMRGRFHGWGKVDREGVVLAIVEDESGCVHYLNAERIEFVSPLPFRGGNH